MVVSVIGAGIQGTPCASILSNNEYIDRILLIDINTTKLQKAQNLINSSKVLIHRIDCQNVDQIVEVLLSCKCEICFDFLTPDFAPIIMEACIRADTNYINTAYDNPFWINILENKPLYLDADFKKKGLVALLGCGNSPGMVNVFIRKYCDQLETVSSIRIFGAYEPQEPKLLTGWNPGWSIKQAYIDFISRPCVFRNGTYQLCLPFSEQETISFPYYGKKNVALHSHEESYSLPLNIKKGIDCCEFKYEIDDKAAVFYASGFRNDVFIRIDGKQYPSVQLLLNTLEQGNNIKHDEVLNYSTYIEIEGMVTGLKRSIKLLLPPINSDVDKIFKRFGTINIDVALPAIVGMECLFSLKKGICFAEDISPLLFESILHKYIDYKEIILNEL